MEKVDEPEPPLLSAHHSDHMLAPNGARDVVASAIRNRQQTTPY